MGADQVNTSAQAEGGLCQVVALARNSLILNLNLNKLVGSQFPTVYGKLHLAKKQAEGKRRRVRCNRRTVLLLLLPDLSAMRLQVACTCGHTSAEQQLAATYLFILQQPPADLDTSNCHVCLADCNKRYAYMQTLVIATWQTGSLRILPSITKSTIQYFCLQSRGVCMGTILLLQQLWKVVAIPCWKL